MTALFPLQLALWPDQQNYCIISRVLCDQALCVTFEVYLLIGILILSFDSLFFCGLYTFTLLYLHRTDSYVWFTDFSLKFWTVAIILLLCTCRYGWVGISLLHFLLHNSYVAVITHTTHHLLHVFLWRILLLRHNIWLTGIARPPLRTKWYFFFFFHFETNTPECYCPLYCLHFELILYIF